MNNNNKNIRTTYLRSARADKDSADGLWKAETEKSGIREGTLRGSHCLLVGPFSVQTPKFEHLLITHHY